MSTPIFFLQKGVLVVLFNSILVGGLEHFVFIHIYIYTYIYIYILGISSSQLTNSYFSEGFCSKPPTSINSGSPVHLLPISTTTGRCGGGTMELVRKEETIFEPLGAAQPMSFRGFF